MACEQRSRQMQRNSPIIRFFVMLKTLWRGAITEDKLTDAIWFYSKRFSLLVDGILGFNGPGHCGPESNEDTGS